MLAVTITLLFALYVLGPDIFSRIILGFSVPRRNVTLTRGEEVSRAVLWSIVPLFLAFLWAKESGVIGRLWLWQDLDVWFSGVASDQYFRENRAYWFHSTRVVLWLNFAILWRLYAIVLAVGLTFNSVIRNYAKVRVTLRNYPRLRNQLGSLVLPRIAPWHLLLSRILLEKDNLRIHVDVLTKAGILYQGQLADKMLSADGSLVALTLEEPRRFRREQYLEAEKDATTPKPRAEDYWRAIPTNMFVIMGSEVHSINLRYVPENMAAIRLRVRSESLEKTLAALLKAYQEEMKSKP